MMTCMMLTMFPSLGFSPGTRKICRNISTKETRVYITLHHFLRLVLSRSPVLDFAVLVIFVFIEICRCKPLFSFMKPKCMNYDL